MTKQEQFRVITNEVFPEATRTEIISRLEQDLYSKNPQEFLFSLKRSHHLGMLTLYSISELATMDICKVLGYNVGFAIKYVGEYHEIVGVHNNEFLIHGLGYHIVAAAIRAGGNALDHFGSPKLCELYDSLGFMEIRREPYDPNYDPAGTFRSKYGELPVIYRVLAK